MSFAFPPAEFELEEQDEEEDDDDDDPGLGIYTYHRAILGNVGRLGPEGEPARLAIFKNLPCDCGHHERDKPPQAKGEIVRHNAYATGTDAHAFAVGDVLEAERKLLVAFMKKLLNDEIRVRAGRNKMQAKLFGEELDAVLGRYRNRQITSAEVVKALVELAKKLREAKHRHEELGLSEEEAAFYDALAGTAEDLTTDPQIAEIARELVKGIKGDLSVDWTSHESREAAVRVKIKRLLRKHKYRPPAAKGEAGGRGRMSLDEATSLILDQARELYYRWPDVDVELL